MAGTNISRMYNPVGTTGKMTGADVALSALFGATALGHVWHAVRKKKKVKGRRFPQGPQYGTSQEWEAQHAGYQYK